MRKMEAAVARKPEGPRKKGRVESGAKEAMLEAGRAWRKTEGSLWSHLPRQRRRREYVIAAKVRQRVRAT